MAPQTIDYAEVIKDLEHRRAEMNSRIDAAIAAMRQIMALGGTNYAVPVSIPLEGRRARGGPYAGLDMVPAAIKHLSAAGKAVPNVTLAKALEEGGYEHKSKNFSNTLNSVLWRRHKTIGDVRKSGRGWELTPTK